MGRQGHLGFFVFSLFCGGCHGNDETQSVEECLSFFVLWIVFLFSARCTASVTWYQPVHVALLLGGGLCVRHADVILAQSTAAGTPLDIHGIQSLPPGTLFAVPANLHSLTATPGMARGHWRISLLCAISCIDIG
jgi:hypothetical protein